MSSTKVYLPMIVQRYDEGRAAMVPAFDFSQAAMFGQLIEILQPSDDPMFLNRLMPKINASLENFKEGDFFLAVGDPTLIAICAGIILRKHKTINMLKWDRKLRVYTHMEITP